MLALESQADMNEIGHRKSKTKTKTKTYTIELRARSLQGLKLAWFSSGALPNVKTETKWQRRLGCDAVMQTTNEVNSSRVLAFTPFFAFFVLICVFMPVSPILPSSALYRTNRSHRNSSHPLFSPHARKLYGSGARRSTSLRVS